MNDINKDISDEDIADLLMTFDSPFDSSHRITVSISPDDKDVLTIKKLIAHYQNSKTEWVSAGDRLPSNDKQVEVVFFTNMYEWQTGMFSPSNFNDGEGYVFQRHNHTTDDSYETIHNVKYWKSLEPLPTPPTDKV